MKFFKRILSAAVIATLAMSVVATTASAHNPQNYKAPGGIIPALAGPFGAAALFPSTSTFSWFTHSSVFSHSNYYTQIFHKWHQIPKAKYDLIQKVNSHLPKKLKVPVKKDDVYNNVKTKHSKSSKNVGKAVVGCIMGSAFGAITASVRKASALGNPPRWRSQAEHERIVASGYEKQFELTNDEAQTALALCGLGSFTLHWQPSPRP